LFCRAVKVKEITAYGEAVEALPDMVSVAAVKKAGPRQETKEWQNHEEKKAA